MNNKDPATTIDPISLDTTFEQILSQFPNIDFIIAYGSGIYLQPGYKQQPMIDLLFGVENSLQWHQQNMEINSHHYSSLKYLGINNLVKIQEMSAGIYYNTLIPMGNIVNQYSYLINFQQFICVYKLNS
jgi:translocator assembly and maintenance protein 41